MNTKILALIPVLSALLRCTAAWAGHGSPPQEEPGIFSGTIADAVWTVMAFLVLLVVLSKFAWRPLLNALNTRQTHIEQQLRTADESRQRAEQMLGDYKQQGLSIVNQAADQAQRHQQQAAEETRQELLTLRRRAQEDIEHARSAALERLWKDAGDIVLQLGSNVIGRTITEQDNQRLIDEAVAKIRQDGGAR